MDRHWTSERQKPAALDEPPVVFDLDDADEGQRRTLIEALDAFTPVVTRREAEQAADRS